MDQPPSGTGKTSRSCLTRVRAQLMHIAKAMGCSWYALSAREAGVASAMVYGSWRALSAGEAAGVTVWVQAPRSSGRGSQAWLLRGGRAPRSCMHACLRRARPPHVHRAHKQQATSNCMPQVVLYCCMFSCGYYGQMLLPTCFNVRTAVEPAI